MCLEKLGAPVQSVEKFSLNPPFGRWFGIFVVQTEFTMAGQSGSAWCVLHSYQFW